jgi:hypothetical protein
VSEKLKRNNIQKNMKNVHVTELKKLAGIKQKFGLIAIEERPFIVPPDWG